MKSNCRNDKKCADKQQVNLEFSRELNVADKRPNEKDCKDSRCKC